MAKADSGQREAAPAVARRRVLLALAAIVVAAAALRIAAAGGDLWLDEIWSLDNVAVARAWSDAEVWLALMFHDNTHPLNTFYLAAVGPDASSFTVRALSVATGTAAVAMAAAIGWRRSVGEGLIAAALVGASYPMVHYAGEARGYAPMLLAALAAYDLLGRWLGSGSRGQAVAFVVVSLLGLAAHATFVVVLAGLGVWAAAALYRRLGSAVSTAAALIGLFGAQLFVVVCYAALAWHNLVIGGGAMMPAREAALAMLALSFGADPAWPGGGAIAAALALAAVAAVFWIYRLRDRSWPVFAIVAVAFPLAFAVIDPPIGTVPRYFIAAALFALLAVARALAALMAAGPRPRLVAAGVLALVLAGDANLLAEFFAVGRGDYAKAVRDIAAAGTGPARVAGYHPFSVGTLVAYYARRQGLADAVRFVSPEDEEKTAPAEWFIAGHFEGRTPEAALTRAVANAVPVGYRLIKVYPHWGLSGDTWAVYRRAE